jgi:hypothetical protein
MFCASSAQERQSWKRRQIQNTKQILQKYGIWPGGSQNGKWWEIKGLTTVIQAAIKKTFAYIFIREKGGSKKGFSASCSSCSCCCCWYTSQKRLLGC